MGIANALESKGELNKLLNSFSPCRVDQLVTWQVFAKPLAREEILELDHGADFGPAGGLPVGAIRFRQCATFSLMLHSPQGDTCEICCTMIEREGRRPPATYTTFQARDLGSSTAEWL